MIPLPEIIASGESQGIRLTSQDGILQLGMRAHSLEQEIAELHLPDNTAMLLDLALKARQDRLESRYSQVAIWLELKKHGDFWKALGYKSLEELWVNLDLPGGITLAYWENLVRTFSKETFLLVGEACLSYMVRYVSSYQPDLELRQHDYQQIFEFYCLNHVAFDAKSFRRQINLYVNTHYIAPSLDEPKEVKQRKEPEAKRLYQKHSKICERCVLTGELLIASLAHIESLEYFISENVGRKFIPAKPGRLLEAEIITGKRVA